jgi:hypothetical protein
VLTGQGSEFVLTGQGSEIVLTGQGSEITNSRFRNFRTNTAFGMLDVCVCVRACVCLKEEWETLTEGGGRLGWVRLC